MEWISVQTNWFDFVLVIIVILYVYQLWDHGLYLVISEFVSWVAAWAAGLFFGPGVADFLVTTFGVASSVATLISLLVIMVVVEQVVYRGLGALLALLPRQYFSTFWQAVLGIIPALLTGLMVVSFLVLLLLLIPYDYPIKDVIVSSWFGQNLLGWVESVQARLLERMV